MPSKLLMLHGEANLICFAVSCVPESSIIFCCFSYLLSLVVYLLFSCFKTDSDQSSSNKYKEIFTKNLLIAR